MSVAIGIDLGTTNTVVAAVIDGVAVTLEDEEGRRLIPSVVSFHPSSTVLVGEPARERRLIDPENTIFSVKPLLGRAFDSEEVKAAKARFPFHLTQGAKNSTMVLARDVAYALPEISAFVLRRAKAVAEAALGQTVDRAVITVPANFNDLQRASTKIAGKLAGLDVMRILNEPTAAALAYGQSIAKAEKIGVYDLGGGTFDVTLLDLTGNVFEVLATAGDTALGGDDIDRVLAERIAFEVIKRYNVDPRTNPAASARLTFIAEELKKELSNAYQAQREITGVGYTEGGLPITMPFVMTRDELEKLTSPLIERTIQVAKQSVEIIGLTPRDFDRVILVGGSTRMPLVARMVEQLFGQPPHLKVNPDEVVALGAAIQAHALNRTKSAHKRRVSAHEQLAHAQPNRTGEQQTRPPDANPMPTAQDVPKAPALPTNFGIPADQLAATTNSAPLPEFFTFNKAPAVITFSSSIPGAPSHEPPQPPPQQQPPPARPQASAKPQPPPLPRKPPPPVPGSPSAAPVLRPRVPTASQPTSERMKLTPPEPTAPPSGNAPVSGSGGSGGIALPRRGGSGHQSQPATAAAARASARPIEGRTAFVDDGPIGPKPARRITGDGPPSSANLPVAPPAKMTPAKMTPAKMTPAKMTPAKMTPPQQVGSGASAVKPETSGILMASPSSGKSDIVAAPELDFDLDMISRAADVAAAESALTENTRPTPPVPAPTAIAQIVTSAEDEEIFERGGIPAFTSERFQQGSAITTSATAPLLIDVTPLSLGVETAGGYADVLIPANSPVPCEKTRTFLTASDSQTTVSIRVAQGQSSRFAANTRLGDLVLSGLRPARRGEVKILVTFELDADGILNVRARDQDTGRETAASMKLLGTQSEAEDMGEMAARQARHVVA